MRCVPLIWENVLHTQNMFSSCLENFLEALKVKNSPKSVEYSEAKLAFWVANFVKIQIFCLWFYLKWLTCRMDLIQCALCSPDEGDDFVYPEHVLKLCRKFSKATQNNIRQNILAQIKLFWRWISWKIKFFKLPSIKNVFDVIQI